MSIFGVSAGPQVWPFQANELAVSRVVLDKGVTISTLWAVTAKQQTGLNVKACIYSHNATTNRPANLLATSAVRTSVPGGDCDFTFSPSIFLPAGTYWMGLHSDVTILSSDATLTGSTYYFIQPYNSGIPATWPTGASVYQTTSTRPIYGVYDLGFTQISKLNTYAVITNQVAQPVRVSETHGYLVSQDPFDPIHVSQARGYLVSQDPNDPIHVAQARGYLVSQDPNDPIHVAETHGYLVAQDANDPQLISQVYGYLVSQDPFDALAICQTYGYLVTEDRNDTLKIAKASGYLVMDVDPLDTRIHVTT
jgi:hypothetical protein